MPTDYHTLKNALLDTCKQYLKDHFSHRIPDGWAGNSSDLLPYKPKFLFSLLHGETGYNTARSLLSKLQSDEFNSRDAAFDLAIYVLTNSGKGDLNQRLLKKVIEQHGLEKNKCFCEAQFNPEISLLETVVEILSAQCKIENGL